VRESRGPRGKKSLLQKNISRLTNPGRKRALDISREEDVVVKRGLGEEGGLCGRDLGEEKKRGVILSTHVL